MAPPDQRVIDELAAQLCDIYSSWPPSRPDDPRIRNLQDNATSLGAALLDELAGDTLAVHASRLCPTDIAPGSVAAGSGLPRPANLLDGIPGLYDASTASDAEELRARYEWTAIGLGCAAVADEPRDVVGDGGNDFLNAMGFTLDTYVEESLGRQDPMMSERIFAAIHACADRVRGPVTPRVEP